MKTTSIITTFALFAFTLFSHANAEDAAAPPARKSYAVQIGQTSVAILPSGKDNSMEATADSVIRDPKTDVMTMSGHVRIVIAVLGKSPITISGDELTVIPQK